MTKQLIQRLGGVQGARVFKIPGSRRLLRRHGPLASFSEKSALELIGSTDEEDPSAKFSDHYDLFIEGRDDNTKLTPQAVFAYLVAKGLYRVGAEVTCSNCSLTSWTSINELCQRLTCELCGEVYDATRQLIRAKWSFRRSGTLGLEKNADGAVPGNARARAAAPAERRDRPARSRAGRGRPAARAQGLHLVQDPLGQLALARARHVPARAVPAQEDGGVRLDPEPAALGRDVVGDDQIEILGLQLRAARSPAGPRSPPRNRRRRARPSRPRRPPGCRASGPARA